MSRRTPEPNRTATPFPCTTSFRSGRPGRQQLPPGWLGTAAPASRPRRSGVAPLREAAMTIALRRTASAFETASLKDRVGPEEWKVRVDLAALYRLVARYGMTDLAATHLSARVPGPEHHFLINPYGLMYEEVTASSLVKIDMNGEIVLDRSEEAHG